MARRLFLLAAAAAGAACGPRTRGADVPGHAGAPGDVSLALYRNVAFVEQRVAVDVPEGSDGVARVLLGAGAVISEIEIRDEGKLVVGPIREEGSGSAAPPADAGVDAPPHEFDEDGTAMFDDPPPPLASADDDSPVHRPVPVTIAVAAPAAGHYTFAVRYRTHELTWDVGYTLTTTPARTSVEARGAIVIQNATGLPFPHAKVAVVDDNFDGGAGFGSGTSAARMRSLGHLDVIDGEVRAELYPPGARRAARTTLVYEPIDGKADNTTAQVQRDDAFALTPPDPVPVVETLEIARDRERDAGLPSGPARLVEREPDGSLAVLAGGRLFDAQTRAGTYDDIPLGVAHDLVGKRRRRDFEVDEERGRATESFTLEVTSTRATPAEVALHEHMLRGAQWTLGFSSAPFEQTGPQEVTFRARVPPHGKASVMYVVVYWWDKSE